MLEITPDWHPFIIHFPIALVIAATLCFAGVGFSRVVIFSDSQYTSRTTRELLGASKWSLWLGALFSALAVLTGWLAEGSATYGKTAREAIELHETWGFLTAECLVLFAVISIAFREQWGKKAYKTTLVAFFILSGFVCITTWLGTKIVYQHGIGIQSYLSTDKESHLPN